ncbi:MAG: hypothetical protein MJ156_00770 [Alphaproteobacteria bacterium]|nr:hypothetical protein [Alphaproteobacteria bacterium]
MTTTRKNGLNRFMTMIFRPKDFFSKIVADGNMEESIFRALLWGCVGGIFVLVMSILSGKAFTFGLLFKSIIIAPVLAVVLLFVLSGLLMLFSEIAGGERDWEITVKGLASVFFVYPLTLILNALAFNCVSIWVVSILTDAYMLFLLYNIVVYCLHGKKISVLFVLLVISLFLACLYTTDYRTFWFFIKNTSATVTCLF